MKFWKLENLFDANTDSVTFSFYSETYQKVRKLSIRLNQQEIQISRVRHGKFSFFSLWVSLIKLCILILFSFFHFRVTWPGNRVRGNLPIDFEIMIPNFERLYGLSYIKRKHVICRFQKDTLPWNSKLMVKITVTFRYEWSKWPFYTKMIWSGHVTHQSKAYELNIPKKSFSL